MINIHKDFIPYMEIEKEGIMMPVYSVEAKYRDVLRYDELITIETTIKTLPTARIEFFNRIFNEKGALAHEARVVLVFQDVKSGKIVRAPEILVDLLRSRKQDSNARNPGLSNQK